MTAVDQAREAVLAAALAYFDASGQDTVPRSGDDARPYTIDGMAARHILRVRCLAAADAYGRAIRQEPVAAPLRRVGA
jgi:hypothetical protein